MDDSREDIRRNRNIWAPWRMQYVSSIGPDGPDGGCFLCRNRDEKEDERNLVLWRGRRAFAMLNLFPYVGGHAMVAPYEHVGGLDALDEPTLLELMTQARDLRAVLSKALDADGFNVGINLGRCAGAGLPGHLHVHVVPRWRGDTNFIPVLADVRVIPVSLEEVYDLVRGTADELGLPNLPSAEGR